MTQKKIKEPAVEPIEVEPVAEAKPAAVKEVKTRCINCGQNDRPILQKGNELGCPACKHTWTPDDEQSPFRRIQRGQM